MKIGLTFANLNALGNLFKDIERLQISVTGLVRTSAPSFRNLPGSLSMPAAFEVSINPNWPKILDHPYTILIIGGSRSGKTNAILNLIKQDGDDYTIIAEIYLYVKDLIEAKYQYLLKNMKKLVLKRMKVQRFLLNTQICRMSIKILKIATQIEYVKY